MVGIVTVIEQDRKKRATLPEGQRLYEHLVDMAEFGRRSVGEVVAHEPDPFVKEALMILTEDIPQEPGNKPIYDRVDEVSQGYRPVIEERKLAVAYVVAMAGQGIQYVEAARRFLSTTYNFDIPRRMIGGLDRSLPLSTPQNVPTGWIEPNQ